jgi:hypothetical protein
VYAWLPTITHLFPGAGITPWTVQRLTLRWWLIYARQAKEYVADMKAQEAKRGK